MDAPPPPHIEKGIEMSRVPPTPVEIWADGRWHRGTVRTCEVSADGTTCSAVVSWDDSYVRTGRFTPSQLRHPSGTPGCPVQRQLRACG